MSSEDEHFERAILESLQMHETAVAAAEAEYSCTIHIGNRKELFNLPIGEMQVIVDCRSPAEFQRSHISGSFNLPIEECAGEITIGMEEALIQQDMYPDSYRIVCIYGREGSALDQDSGPWTLAKTIKAAGGVLQSKGDKRLRRVAELFIVESYEDFEKQYSFLITRDTTLPQIAAAPLFFPSQISDWCYLGSHMNASDKEALRCLGVSVIINCTLEIPNVFEKDGLFEYHKFEVIDSSETDMLKTWEGAYDILMRSKRTGRKVLVHCAAGVSRSASTIIYAVIRGNKIPLSDAYAYVRSCRSIANPNDGFMCQLKMQEESLLLETDSPPRECFLEG